MRAALLVEPGIIKIDEVPDPEPGTGEVRVAVGGVGLCGSDLSVFTGRWEAPSYPWIMGHEAFGVIESVGSDVSADRVGQTVVIEPNAACFLCDQCDRGWTSACAGRRSVGMNRPGALAEYLVVPSRYAWSIAGGLPPRDMVCVEPTTVAMAALRRLRVPLPESALVVGVGAQGLTMSLTLMERGVEVYTHDVNPERVSFSTELGAHPVPADDDHRFDLVVDTVGSPRSMSVSVDRAEFGGTVICLGLDNRPLELTSQTLVRRQVSLQGSLTYDHPTDFEESVALVSSGDVAPGRIVTDEYTLEEAQIAFDRSRSAKGKTFIRIAETY